MMLLLNIFFLINYLDHIYGKEDASDLERITKSLWYYDEIAKFTENTWKEYLKK